MPTEDKSFIRIPWEKAEEILKDILIQRFLPDNSKDADIRFMRDDGVEGDYQVLDTPDFVDIVFNWEWK